MGITADDRGVHATAYSGCMDGLSKSAVNRLGKRLREAETPSAEDVALYVGWCAEFSEALEEVECSVAEQAEQVGKFEIASRTKQISSVIAKLNRMNRSNLARIEDIVGCRVIVPTLLDQERLALRCAQLNVSRNPRDYRRDSQNGYRAVHFTIRASTDQLVEVQLRTEIQHTWARLTERMAAIVDPALKYGGGPVHERQILDLLSFQGYLLDLDLDSQNARVKLADKFWDYAENHLTTFSERSRMPEARETLWRRFEDIRAEIDEFLTRCDTLAPEGRAAR